MTSSTRTYAQALSEPPPPVPSPPLPESPADSREDFLNNGLKTTRLRPTDDKLCGICLTTYNQAESGRPSEEPVRFLCGHVFGFSCVIQNVDMGGASRNRCPKCRAVLFRVPDSDDLRSWLEASSASGSSTYNPYRDAPIIRYRGAGWSSWARSCERYAHPLTCDNCESFGHMEHDCPHPQLCYRCRQPTHRNHHASSCRRRPACWSCGNPGHKMLGCTLLLTSENENGPSPIWRLRAAEGPPDEASAALPQENLRRRR